MLYDNFVNYSHKYITHPLRDFINVTVTHTFVKTNYATMQLQNNSTLQDGKYRIIRVLGQGGFGITYLSEHTMLGKLVAIKEFFPKEYCDREETTNKITVGTKNTVDIVDTLKAKFIKEARNISKLSHTNIVTIFDIFQENETAYYVMEYIDGHSLAELLKLNGPMAEEDALRYIRKIANAVNYMHSLSMNHLDLKPANIMVRSHDNEPILIDFGLSKQYDAVGDQTSTTPIGVSHGYAPIEQYRPGGVSTFSPQTDVYALGATLYALITAKTPPHYSEILENGIYFQSAISESLKCTIEKSLEIKRCNRPQDIESFLVMLGTINRPDSMIEQNTSNHEQDDKQTDIEQLITTEVNEETTLINSLDKSPEIQIKKRRGLNPRTRSEIIQISWKVLYASKVYFLLNGNQIEAAENGWQTLMNSGDKFQLCVVGGDGSVINTEVIEYK